MFGIGKKEFRVLKKLKTPRKIQDFLDTIKINFEEDGATNLSPMSVLEKGICHCMEGAMLAALALRVNGYPPLLVDLKANAYDHDHVVAVFRQNGKWGAISKTNHATLRYRDPIYNSIRELAMSYFNEYYDEYGDKNLRSYSRPVNLRIFDKKGWMTVKGDVGYIPKYLDKVKHFSLLNIKQIRSLRKADKVQLETDKIIEWKSKDGQWYV
jgi:hypothetical protein